MLSNSLLASCVPKITFKILPDRALVRNALTWSIPMRECHTVFKQSRTARKASSPMGKSAADCALEVLTMKSVILFLLKDVRDVPLALIRMY